jgi:hypothetical protein
LARGWERRLTEVAVTRKIIFAKCRVALLSVIVSRRSITRLSWIGRDPIIYDRGD